MHSKILFPDSGKIYAKTTKNLFCSDIYGKSYCIIKGAKVLIERHSDSMFVFSWSDNSIKYKNVAMSWDRGLSTINFIPLKTGESNHPATRIFL